jgi:hypothetical protein
MVVQHMTEIDMTHIRNEAAMLRIADAVLKVLRSSDIGTGLQGQARERYAIALTKEVMAAIERVERSQP